MNITTLSTIELALVIALAVIVVAVIEDLRQAMIKYRTLFEELVGQPELARAKTTS